MLAPAEARHRFEGDKLAEVPGRIRPDLGENNLEARTSGRDLRLLGRAKFLSRLRFFSLGMQLESTSKNKPNTSAWAPIHLDVPLQIRQVPRWPTREHAALRCESRPDWSKYATMACER